MAQTPFGIGDQTATGATARAAKGNQALAVSLIGPSSAVVLAGSNNNAFAFDGGSVIKPTVTKDGLAVPNGNNVFTSYGLTTVEGPAEGNTIVNAGGFVQASGKAASEASVSFCGTSLSGQAEHITVGPMADGLC